MNQTDLFIKYVEYAEKFGALEELRLDAAGVSLVELFHLDLIGLSLLCLLTLFSLILFVSKRILKLGRFLTDQWVKVSKTKKID